MYLNTEQGYVAIAKKYGAINKSFSNKNGSNYTINV